MKFHVEGPNEIDARLRIDESDDLLLKLNGVVILFIGKEDGILYLTQAANDVQGLCCNKTGHIKTKEQKSPQSETLRR